MSQHTPGRQWGVMILPCEPTLGPEIALLIGINLVTRDRTIGYSRADALLMAAAPDLLAIAKSIVSCAAYPRGSEAQIRCLEECLQDAKSAIAKAKGATS